MIIVSDTSPISNLAAIRQLDLLRQLYGFVIIPTGVYQELLNADETNPGMVAMQTLNWIQARSVHDLSLLRSLQIHLDIGEAEAIALAIELKADRLLIDERRGRTIALQSGLKVTGLLGILVAAKQQRLIPLVKPLLDELIVQDFWIRRELYLEVLHLAQEL